MSDDNQALIREIQEEVRREKLLRLWNQYGTWAIGAVAALVVLFGGWQWYSAYQLDRAQKAGGRFEEALNLLGSDAKDEKRKDAVALLEGLADDGAAGYASLARLRLAATHRAADENDQALALYEAVANDNSADKLLRSFASLQIASLKIDSGTWTELENRLNQLAGDSDPWRHSARELLGVAAYKHQQWGQAKQAYTSLLGDPSVPQAIRQRAQTAMALIAREEETNTAGTATKSDLKKDKSAGKDEKSEAEAGGGKPAASNEAGAANNESETNKQ